MNNHNVTGNTLLKEEYVKTERTPEGSIRITTQIKQYYPGLEKTVESNSVEIF